LGTTSHLEFFNSKSYPIYVSVPIEETPGVIGFVSQLEKQALGCVASNYRTSALRLATANYLGDLCVVLNSDFANLPLSSEILVKSLKSQSSSALSGSNATGTPLDFTCCNIDSITPPSTIDSVQDITVSLANQPLGTSVLVGLKTPGTTLGVCSSNWKGYWANVGPTSNLGLTGGLWVAQLGLRETSKALVASGQPVVLVSPLHIGPYDDFNVIVDKDSEMGLFNISMARRVKPAAASNYGSTITLTEIGGASLSTTFGLGYLFEDFAIYMKARAKSHPNDPTRTALWRYYRHGQDGESFGVRYSYPTKPNSSLSVTINHNQDTLDLIGALRSTIDINSQYQVGVLLQ
jgi:hypothetical protein